MSGLLKTPSYRYLLAFGSNIGNRHKNFKNALMYLQPYLNVMRQTRWKTTSPLTHPLYDTSEHQIYLNFVCEVESALTPAELYQVIFQIENLIGHSRERRWLSRHLDIDILFCVLNEEKSFSACTPYLCTDPTVPHKEYFNRTFWQEMVEGELEISRKFLGSCYTECHIHH